MSNTKVQVRGNAMFVVFNVVSLGPRHGRSYRTKRAAGFIVPYSPFELDVDAEDIYYWVVENPPLGPGTYSSPLMLLRST